MKQSRLPIFPLILILIVAGALRMYAPELTEYKRDEATLSRLALELARGHKFPLLGISSSVGFPNAPMSVYLLAPAYLFTSDPLPATLWIILLNTAAVGMLVLLATRTHGGSVGWIAGGVYALAVWAILYSRKIWAQELLPPFVVLTVGTGLIGYWEGETGRRWARISHWVLLAITVQLHYVGFFVIPISAYLWLFAGSHRRLRETLIGLGLAALVCLPYGVGLFEALRSGALGVSRETLPVTISPKALEYTLILLSGTEIHSLAGPDVFESYLAQIPPIAWLILKAGAVVSLLSAGWIIVRIVWRRDRRAVLDGVLILWAITIPLLFTLTWTPVYPHYLIPMLPAAAWIVGVAVTDAARRFGKFIWGLAGIGLVSYAVTVVGVGLTLFNVLGSTNTPGGFGTPLRDLRKVREAVIQSSPSDLLLELDGQFIGENDQATVWYSLLYDLPVRPVPSQLTVSPAISPLRLSQPTDCLPSDFFLRSGEGCYRLRSQATFSALANPINSAAFQNGLRVTGYQWEKNCVTVEWSVVSIPSDPVLYTVAVHFFGADDVKVGQADRPTWHSRYWRRGDRIQEQFCASQDAVTRAEIGVYIYQPPANFTTIPLETDALWITLQRNAP
jgi:4-amino-4-deoxy-L-arabinose transferase-like glycosyltransferase